MCCGAVPGSEPLRTLPTISRRVAWPQIDRDGGIETTARRVHLRAGRRRRARAGPRCRRSPWRCPPARAAKAGSAWRRRSRSRPDRASPRAPSIPPLVERRSAPRVACETFTSPLAVVIASESSADSTVMSPLVVPDPERPTRAVDVDLAARRREPRSPWRRRFRGRRSRRAPTADRAPTGRVTSPLVVSSCCRPRHGVALEIAARRLEQHRHRHRRLDHEAHFEARARRCRRPTARPTH